VQIARGPGWIFSLAAHGALLAALAFAWSDAPKFTDAQETVPVEILTEEQVNQIVKGSKDVKKDRRNQRADKIAKIIESNPKPPVNEAKKNIPTPTPKLKRLPDPQQDPEPREPVQKTAALPPPRPPQKSQPGRTIAPAPPRRPPPTPKNVQTTPEPAKPVKPKAIAPPVPPQRPKPEIKQAHKSEPQPEPKAKPKPEKLAPTVPLPPQRPRHLARHPARKVQPEKPKQLQPRPDKLAKLIRKDQRSRPRSGDESNEPQRKFDTSAISRLLSKERAQRRSSSGQTLQRQARRGSQTASAAKMSPSMWGQLDGLMQEQYKRCWSYLGIAQGRRYIPQIRVAYAPSGRLTARPVLLNPPSDPSLKPLAASALRAVRKCDPLRIPAQFLPYYEQWKARILRFDPEEMLG